MTRRLLALDPGTRFLGFAVFDGPRLVYHGVEILPRARDARDGVRNGRKTVARLLRDFRPDRLAFEDAIFGTNRRAARVEALVRAIEALAHARNLPVRGFAPTTVKRTVTGDGWAEKALVARFVVSRYPDLKPYLAFDRAWKARFHGHRFDAVAVGLTARRHAADRVRRYVSPKGPARVRS